MLTLAACCLSVARAQTRVWTDASGQHRIEAEFIELSGEGNRIWLQRPDGERFLVPLSDLSADDRTYVRGRVRAAVRAAADAVAAQLEPSDYAPGQEIARLVNPEIDESSGLAVSRREAGLFWTHNDSGDGPRLYAFDLHGADRGTVTLDGVIAFDWEDIASWTRSGKPYLLVGEVGNNGLGAGVHMIYLVEEPALANRPADEPLVVAPSQVVHFCYDDDHHNCEAIAVDPTSQTVLLATKEPGNACHVFALPWPDDNPKKAFIARKIATLAIPSATAMDVSPDGLRAVVAAYGDAYLYTRSAEETWADAFARKPLLVRLPDRIQGESICFGSDGQSLYLTSEKLPTPLIELRRGPETAAGK